MTCYRRSYARIKTDFPAKAYREGLFCGEVTVRDISSRGACILSLKNFDINERVEMHMRLPSVGDFVVKKAKVVWKSMLKGSLCQAGLDFGLDNMIELPAVL